MLQLAGDPAAPASTAAKTILDMETALAKASLTRVERRDPYKNYHKLTFANLQKRTPHFKWTDYRSAAGIPGVSDLNVQHLPFFEMLNHQLQTRSSPIGRRTSAGISFRRPRRSCRRRSRREFRFLLEDAARRREEPATLEALRALRR